VLCVSLGLVSATRESRFSYLLSANTYVLMCTHIRAYVCVSTEL
jgi:hypothetical protein